MPHHICISLNMHWIIIVSVAVPSWSSTISWVSYSHRCLLARAGIRKHGKEAEKVLLKEFVQFKDMDMMVALELSEQQIKDSLDMVNIIQEKRDHTPKKTHLKGRGCADGSKQCGLYPKEETTSPRE